VLRGHSFLKDVEDAPPSCVSVGTIRHPAICVISGHFLHFLTKRSAYTSTSA